MLTLKNPRHEAFAQALARGLSAAAAYIEAGYKANRHNAAGLAREKHIRTRVGELQEEQLALHQQATAEAAAGAKVTIEKLIAEAEAARLDGKIKEIADYCETDVVNTYRVWLRYELFRGKLSDIAFQASETNLSELLKARSNTKPHLAELT